jgi:hypothetical protein
MKKQARLLIACITGNLFTGQALASTVGNNDVLDINGADSFVTAYSNSTVNLLPNSDVAFLDLYDNSTANLLGGNLSWLTLHGTSTANLYSSDLSWLVVGENAKVNIFGYNFSYAFGHLSGNWADGEAFSFWAVNGLAGPLPTNTMPSNINLNAVPLPASSLLFASSLALLGFGYRKRTSVV